MGRTPKKGLDYYPLNVDFLQDIKIRKIMKACGAQSVAILISLLSSIYRDEGYYVVWDSDMSFLVADEVGTSEGAVLETVNKAIQVNFFNEHIYKEYDVLTSKGIQERFLEATVRRNNIHIFKEYLLINVSINSNNVNINSINAYRSTQSKVKESKEKNIKNIVQNDCTISASKADINSFFETVWKLYPNKKGKGQISDTKKKKLYEVGFEHLDRAIKRYIDELKKDEWRKLQNGSTFFNSGYIDYLDGNFQPSEGKRPSNNNKFNQFPQRQYTAEQMSEIERKLINKEL